MLNHPRNRPFIQRIPPSESMSPPVTINNTYAPSLCTESGAMEPQDEPAAPPQPQPPSPPPAAVENVQPEDTNGAYDEVVDGADATEAEQQEPDQLMERRRPSPPSFFKHLGEELQLDEPIKQLQSPNQSFHYSKQHTGLKNLSFNVGAAVMPSAKMEFDQEQPASFGVVKINRPARRMLPKLEPHRIIGRKKHLRLDVPNPEKLMASKSAENLTDPGYLDLKFYHNKLW